jgi:hypothetical protein
MSIGVLTATAATPPKVGSSCLKEGQALTVNGYKYICSKSGKKLIWGKGVLAAPPLADISKDPRITAQSELTDISKCKAVDISNIGTSSSSPSNGFPRPSYALYQKDRARVLVVPLTLPDSPFTSQDTKNLDAAMKRVVAFYKVHSFGRFNIEYSVLDPTQGIRDKRTVQELGLGVSNGGPMIDRSATLKLLLEDWTPPSNIDSFDSLVIESGRNDKGFAGVALPGETLKTAKGQVQRITFEFGSQTQDPAIIAHELGHVLFGYEDLYIQDPTSAAAAKNPTPAGPWDLMSVADSTFFDGNGFFGWNKFLAGWLQDSEVRCVWDQLDSYHYLTDVKNTNGNKLVLVRLQNGVTLAIENRPGTKFISSALVYKIDSRIGHGSGPIQSLRVLENGSSPFVVDGIRLQVLGANKDGLLLRIQRTSPLQPEATFAPTNKPEPAVTPTTNPDDLTSKICNTLNEIVRNSAGEFWCLATPSDGSLRWSKNNPPGNP